MDTKIVWKHSQFNEMQFVLQYGQKSLEAGEWNENVIDKPRSE